MRLRIPGRSVLPVLTRRLKTPVWWQIDQQFSPHTTDQVCVGTARQIDSVAWDPVSDQLLIVAQLRRLLRAT